MWPFPGAGYGYYLPLKEILTGEVKIKGHICRFKDGYIYCDGTVIQGLRISEGYAFIAAVHYTSWENATQIRSMRRIEPSLNDPFVYLTPPGTMQDWTEETIRKEIGANAANTDVKIRLSMPVERVWIKFTRSKIVHFAISGLVDEHMITDLEIQKHS